MTQCRPDLVALRNTIFSYLEKKAYQEAWTEIEKLRQWEPQEALGLAVSCAIEAGDMETAQKYLTELLCLAPQDVYARFLKARIAYEQKQWVTARAILLELLDEPHLVQDYREKTANLLGLCSRRLGENAKSVESYLMAAENAVDWQSGALEYSNYLFNRHYLWQTDLVAAREAAAGYNRFLAQVEPFLARRPQMKKKLRVGYISPDFRQHVVLCFCYVMLTAFSPDDFEVYAYSTSPQEDEYSEKLQQKVTVWRNIAGMPVAQAARCIYEDQLDILVDLAGHTRNNCLPVLAYHPAPLQLSGIGYFASTGLAAVDYFLGDVWLDGDDVSQEFTEQLLILPHSHFCYRPFQPLAAAAEPAFTRNGYITFGSFNAFAKVTDEVLQVWSQILAQVPESRLFLKAEVFDHEESRTWTLQRLAKAGIALERVIYQGITQDYLQEYYNVDIALDTFPYPGGGTTCDALYMGVPVIALQGKSHGERFARSLLENIGLGELCTLSQADYIQKAVALANDRGLMTLLHQQLRGMMERSPLMDAKLYMNDLETAYKNIWQKWQAGQETVGYQQVRQLRQQMQAFLQQGDSMQALACADRILAAKPHDDSLRVQLAELYVDAGEASNAQIALTGLFHKDGYYYYLTSLSAGLEKRYTEAAEFCQLALQDDTLAAWQRGAVHHQLAELYKRAGQREKTAEEYRQSSTYKDLAHGQAADYSNYLLNLHFTAQDRMAAGQAAAGVGQIFAQLPQYPHNEHKKHDRLRIGYISPDFRRHIVAAFSQAFFSAADRDEFAVYGYATCAPDDMTERMAAKADVWRNLSGMSAAEQAAVIYRDELDILVDLSGHTGNNALPVLAYKPAPIQLSGIGYFATTGLPAVDYFLVDEITAESGEDKYWIESLLRLPCSHFCYTQLMEAPALRTDLPADENGYITFGSLNQFDKITDEMLLAWREILKVVPAARLLIKAGAVDDHVRMAQEKERFQRLGMPLERIDFAGYTADYLLAYQQIDIALDTYPYPGGGTTCDALFMGVPVITRYGHSHHTRFGLSLLAHLDLAETCAAADCQEYVAKAVAVAQNEELRLQWRQLLRSRMQDAAVMNGKGYMAYLEQAYWQLTQQAVIDWSQRAFAYHQQGKQEKAYAAALLALKDTKASHLQLYYIAAWACQQTGRWQQAYDLAEEALHDKLAMAEKLPEVKRQLNTLRASAAYQLGRPEAADLYQQAAGFAEGNTRRELFSSSLMARNCLEMEPEKLWQYHQAYQDLFAGVTAYQKWQHRAGKKLRIGYLSADFREHVMLHFYQPFLQVYNKNDFEVYCYDVGTKPDGYTQQLRCLVDKWRQLDVTDPAQAASIIHEDGIDILVDLGGHSAGGGLPILAWKPAPVQISGLGYMATTGLRAVDYIWADDKTAPPGMQEAFFTEKILRLASLFCYVPNNNLSMAKGAPCSQNGYITFGVFNHYRKFTAEMLSAWWQIMQAVPDSVLLLKCQAYRDERLVRQAWQRLKQAGFDMRRVVFEPATRNYMERYLAVDIALDTYPYPGGGTTCDALYMGVPVVTRYGRRFGSRFGYSILTAMGLEELAVPDMASYIQKAVSLAGDRQLLQLLHENLRPMMQKSALMDASGYMEQVEAFYRKVAR